MHEQPSPVRSRIEAVRAAAAEERPLQVGVEWVRELAAEIDALIRPAPLAASEPVAWGIFTKGIGLVGHRSNQRQSITAMMASGVGDYTAPLYTHPSAAAGSDLRFVEVCAFNGLLPSTVTVLRRLAIGGRIRGSEDRDALAWLASRLQWAMDQETAAPAAPVVELDEWRVVDKDNRTYLGTFSSSDVAEQWRRNANVLHHENAPHRVMRVCLKEVDI